MYSTNARLQKPATSDRNWDVPINANVDAIDGMSAIGGLILTTTETPSATLNVAVSPGNFANSSGLVISFPGVTSFALPASSTVAVWLTDTGVLTTGMAFPTTVHLRLAKVVSGPSSLIQVVDERIQCRVAGSGMGFVLKAGDTMNGALTVASPTTGVSQFVADPVNGLIGFFGVAPASQVASLLPLTTTSSGVPSNLIADVGSAYSQAVLNNNFASVVAKVDALIAALKCHGLMRS